MGKNEGKTDGNNGKKEPKERESRNYDLNRESVINERNKRE
jgi:hypothetical protein